MEFGEEGGKLLICLFKAKEFGSGILYTVWISVGAFKDFQDFGVIVKLADTVSNIRQDLRVRGSREAAINVGHTRERSRESVLINNYLLINLRNKVVEV